MSDFVRVSRMEPCPICGNGSWCTSSSDGHVVHCMRVESNRPAQGNSGGWIHKLDGALLTLPPRRREPPRPAVKIDWPSRARRLFNAPNAPAMRAKLAAMLGVSITSLARLGVGAGQDSTGLFSSWPERNAAGNSIGIIRRYADGSKKHMRGGKAGLYLATGKPLADVDQTLFVPEGGSDVAALLTVGLSAVGRPSNVGGIEMLATLLSGYRGAIVVLGENDRKLSRVGTMPQCPSNCAGCAWCWPGKFGARVTAARLTQMLNRKVHWRLIDGAKDARDWLKTNRSSTSSEFVSYLGLRLPRTSRVVQVKA